MFYLSLFGQHNSVNNNSVNNRYSPRSSMLNNAFTFKTKQTRLFQSD